MHRFCFLFLFITISLNIFGQSVEDIVYDCLKNHYQEQEVNFVSKLADLEKHIIESGYLKGSTGEDYYKFYEDLEQNEEMAINIDTEKFQPLLEYVSLNLTSSEDCRESIMALNPREVSESKFYQIQMSFQEVRSSADNFGPSLISRKLLEILTPSDFEKKLYRSSTLLIILYLSEIGSTQK